MESLYHDPNMKIALAMETMQTETEEQHEKVTHYASNVTAKIPEEAFIKFTERHCIDANYYHIQNRNASFLIAIFRELEQMYGVTREKWWWHNSTFTFWYYRLKDDRLRLTLELGPLESYQRLAIIKRLESLELSFSTQSKQPTANILVYFQNLKS
ncbi:hypothetical protein ACFWM3_17935 [Gottfriedia sp. NPDC058432]|uniref:hypothetical protein n=1 Tax=Gottfriedia sp. NPDC058432 TaxID=3346497 RepID=UPI00364AF47E